MSNPGRPQILDESKKKTILAILSVGGTRATAARYVNCNPKTILNTAKRDPQFDAMLKRVRASNEIKRLMRAEQAIRYHRHRTDAARKSNVQRGICNLIFNDPILAHSRLIAQCILAAMQCRLFGQ